MLFLKNWVGTIISVSMLVLLLEIILPSGRIKKYISLISGIIIILTIIQPLFGFFIKGAEPLELIDTGSIFVEREALGHQSSIYDEENMNQITEVYRQKLISRIQDNLTNLDEISIAKADVIVEENYQSESYGEVQRVYLYISAKGSEGKVKPVSEIKIEEIGRKDINDDKDKNKQQKGMEHDKDLEKKIVIRMEYLLGVDSENIIISWE